MTDATILLTIARPNPAMPILVATHRDGIAIRAGTSIRRRETVRTFDALTPVPMADLVPGRDYAVTLAEDGTPILVDADAENPLDLGAIGGFHFAPGGNAHGRAGGNDVPAINPYSIWDAGFRPEAMDPRGMTLVETPTGARTWLDIYLLGTDHGAQGTSRFGATIADGRSLSSLDYYDTVNIFAEHGKRLPTHDEFVAGAFGVLERSGAPRHPKTTGLDAERTSRYGLMQATGNLYVWGTDGDPDDPRPSLFGGSWIFGGLAGSRRAYLGLWPDDSNESIGARGASDHLLLV